MASNKMIKQAIISRGQDSLYRQCQKRGYVTPVDAMMDVGVLQKSKYEDWPFGRLSFLESVYTFTTKSCPLSCTW